MQREAVRSATVYSAGPSAGVQKEVQGLSGFGHGDFYPEQPLFEFEWHLGEDIRRGLRFGQRDGEGRDGTKATTHEGPYAGAVPAWVS